MLFILKTSTKLPSLHSIDQPEGIIEYKIAARTVWKQLKDLGVVHGPSLFVDLFYVNYITHKNRQPMIEPGLTSSAPVTMTSIPPLSFEGCASSVDTLCTTFSNGKVFSSSQNGVVLHLKHIPYRQLLSDTSYALYS